ncbi:MAG TPA: SMI1/KNR4 family protein [Pirellulales bacterium]|jgi:hypothetical protein|nr:SMI1/KNR4 family protein [Pirellulales bacterium]
MPNIESIAGKVFTDKRTGQSYGVVRAVGLKTSPQPWNALGLVVFAEDECGNAFVSASDGSIHFWDHETDDLVMLAASWNLFVEGCHLLKPTELDPRQVESVWIDPEFAKKFGLKPPGGNVSSADF